MMTAVVRCWRRRVTCSNGWNPTFSRVARRRKSFVQIRRIVDWSTAIIITPASTAREDLSSKLVHWHPFTTITAEMMGTVRTGVSSQSRAPNPLPERRYERYDR
jgi:hypothetical protein